MTDPDLICRDERRRHDVRARGFHGLDYLEVSDDQRTLTVYFLGKAPDGLSQEHVRIEGGVRIRDIRVIDLTVRRQDDELDDRVEVVVDRPGDFSTYALRLIDLDARGEPTGRSFPGFDPRYAHLEFTFKAGCPSDLDCKREEVCPPPQRPEPEIDYLAKDYASFRKLILDRLSLIMPDWQERHVPDLGIALVELLAYVGDYLSYYQDAAANEAYLETARQRISVRRHARLVDYPMHEGCNARAWICVEINEGVKEHTLDDPGNVFFITEHAVGSPPGKVLTAEDLKSIPRGEYEVFEPMTGSPIRFFAAHNRLLFYTWGDAECCLSRGATTATLRDAWIPAEPLPGGEPGQQPAKEPPVQQPPERERALHLQVGDVLIFEEVSGPKTGSAADADPLHRHAVRLTRVEPGVDPLHDQPIVEIAWAGGDALPFPLCLSTIGPPPDCRLLQEVSVARGNVVLVDHGRSIDKPDRPGVPLLEPSKVPAGEPVTSCEGEGRPAEITTVAGRFRPTLSHAPLTFREPLSSDRPSSRVFRQDPRNALPQIALTGMIKTPAGPDDVQWLPRSDLLASRGDDRHFVVEVDNEGGAHLRFGDGDLGRVPDAGTVFCARYRVGNGRPGNVGAEAISHVALRQGRIDGVSLKPRNPLPASGGIDPEPLAEVRLFAPHAFRVRQPRAITAQDYARLAADPLRAEGRLAAGGAATVQRAAAALRWTGSWYEVLVAIDPTGRAAAGEPLLDEIAESLYPVRRIGHDLKVAGAHYVSLDVVMSVCVLPEYLRGHVKAALLDLFSNRRLPDGRLGFFHPDNLTFGEGIEVSRLVAAAQAVPGVESVVVTKLERLYEGPNRELERGVLPLGPFEIARLDNDANFPEQGVLRLEIRGGR